MTSQDIIPDVMGPFHVVKGSHRGRPVFFAVADPQDVIQRHHMSGHFYERPELAKIRAAYRPGGLFFDFGANVGNHSLFAALILKAEVVPVEPNPVAAALLRANVLLNRVESQVELQWLGVGVSDAAGSGMAVQAPVHNLGAGRLVEGGELRLVVADDVVGDRPAAFIKIDTEGMELNVLRGLSKTIARDRPTIFVEVDDDNLEGFCDWIEINRYAILDRFKRYRRGENFLIVPEEHEEFMHLKDGVSL